MSNAKIKFPAGKEFASKYGGASRVSVKVEFPNGAEADIWGPAGGYLSTLQAGQEVTVTGGANGKYQIVQPVAPPAPVAPSAAPPAPSFVAPPAPSAAPAKSPARFVEPSREMCEAMVGAAQFHIRFYKRVFDEVAEAFDDYGLTTSEIKSIATSTVIHVTRKVG